MKFVVISFFALLAFNPLFAETPSHTEGTTSPVAPDRNKEADQKLRDRIAQINSTCAATRGGGAGAPGSAPGSIASEGGATVPPASASGDSGVAGATTPSSSGGNASTGATLFQSKCISCHATGAGGAPKDMASKPKSVKLAALDRMATKAGLSDQEKRDVKAHIESLAN